MTNDFEWMYDIETPLVYEGATFIVDNGNHGDDDFPITIVFTLDTIGRNLVGQPIVNYTMLEVSEGCGYKAGDSGELLIEKANDLIKMKYWLPYENI